MREIQSSTRNGVRAFGASRVGKRCWIEERDRSGAMTKQDERIAREPIGEAFPARGFEVFLHGQGPDVAGAAAVQIDRSWRGEWRVPSASDDTG